MARKGERKQISYMAFVQGWEEWCNCEISLPEYARKCRVSPPTLKKYMNMVLNMQPFPEGVMIDDFDEDEFKNWQTTRVPRKPRRKRVIKDKE